MQIHNEKSKSGEFSWNHENGKECTPDKGEDVVCWERQNGYVRQKGSDTL